MFRSFESAIVIIESELFHSDSRFIISLSMQSLSIQTFTQMCPWSLTVQIFVHAIPYDSAWVQLKEVEAALASIPVM